MSTMRPAADDSTRRAGAIAASRRSVAGLRIGELAQLTGATTRAIRHYHEIGLLAEPARDGSGYRRYAAADVVALARIRRLRTLGMPIEQIADRLAVPGNGRSDTPADAADLPLALMGLADDLTRQIERLTELRAKVCALAASPAADPPVAAWSAALVRAGILTDEGELPEGEHEAIDLIDALVPNGVGELAQQAATLARSPAFRRRLSRALEQFRALSPDAPMRETDKLAAKFAKVVGEAGFVPPLGAAGSSAPVSVPVDVMNKLLGDRLSRAQIRCMLRVRELMETEHR